MRHSLRSVVAGAATLAVAGVMATAAAGSAAAATPPYDPDPFAFGTITFYDTSGHVITSGDATDPHSIAYALASAPKPADITGTAAGLFFYRPEAGKTPDFFGGEQLARNVLNPITSAPEPIKSSANPAADVVGDSLAKSLATAAGDFIDNTGSLADVWQLRLVVSGGQQAYAAASITVDPVTHHWQQVYPAPAVVTAETTTTVAAAPAAPATAPADVTLTSKVTAASGSTVPSGSVEFFEGSTSLGTSPVDSSGNATKVLPAQPIGSYSYSATFVPADRNAFFGSSSAATPYSVQAAPAKATSVAVSGPSTINAGDSASYTATVSPAAAAGTLELFDGSTSLGAPQAGPTATVSTTGLTGGAHSITARFVSADTSAYAGSTSPAISTYVATGACSDPASRCSDPQAFVAEVKPGTLVISTPFTAANPFNLGVLALNSTATELSSGKVTFAKQDPAGEGITITDARAGNLPWTAALQSSAFTSGASSIEAKDLGFTDVVPAYVSGNALQNVSTFANAANSVAAPATGLSAASTFASAAQGAGTVHIDGAFTLNAPTSTPAGIYAGTVTFTIS